VGGAPARGRGRPSKEAKRADHVDRLTRKFVRWSLLLMFVDDRTAVAVVRHSPAIAEDLAAVAERYPWVAKFVDGAVSGGAAFGLVGSLGLLGMEVAANKDMLPVPFNSFLKTPAEDAEAEARIADAQAEKATEAAEKVEGAPVDLAAGTGRLSDLLAGGLLR
jgi:hypothetical protein